MLCLESAVRIVWKGDCTPSGRASTLLTWACCHAAPCCHFPTTRWDDLLEDHDDLLLRCICMFSGQHGRPDATRRSEAR